MAIGARIITPLKKDLSNKAAVLRIRNEDSGNAVFYLCLFQKRIYLLRSMSRYLVLLFLFFSACQSAKQEDHRDTFYLNLSSGSLESLDPAYAKDLYTMWTTHMIYNTLVETDDQLHVVPSLAKKWEISGDGLRYRFYLRNDVFFQEAMKWRSIGAKLSGGIPVAPAPFSSSFGMKAMPSFFIKTQTIGSRTVAENPCPISMLYS